MGEVAVKVKLTDMFDKELARRNELKTGDI
jgi:hypothetical protein